MFKRVEPPLIDANYPNPHKKKPNTSTTNLKQRGKIKTHNTVNTNHTINRQRYPHNTTEYTKT